MLQAKMDSPSGLVSSRFQRLVFDLFFPRHGQVFDISAWWRVGAMFMLLSQ